MQWIYLSPHLDDAVWSCGARIWQQVHQGDSVEVWTICTADPPVGDLAPYATMLHRRWGVGRDASQRRRAEDAAACTRLGAAYRHLNLPDCIYRTCLDGSPRVSTDGDLFTSPLQEEPALIDWLAKLFQNQLDTQARVVCPLALGNHTDHWLTRLAVERLGRRLWYAADFPYSDRLQAIPEGALPDGAVSETIKLTTDALLAWGEAVRCYASQISTFWQSDATLTAALERHAARGWAGTLWCSEGVSVSR